MSRLILLLTLAACAPDPGPMCLEGGHFRPGDARRDGQCYTVEDIRAAAGYEATADALFRSTAGRLRAWAASAGIAGK